MRLRVVLLAVAGSAALACGGPTGESSRGGVAGPSPATGSTAGSPAASPTATGDSGQALLAATPPMGWNDWAHYQCSVSEQVVLDNAQALVSSGLAAKGYDIVTVDDCWMAASRDSSGALVADPVEFPHGMAWLADRLHSMGLRFGIYEDAGSATCAHFPGSGQPQGGGSDHFADDARLFASWGVDYLKLDGCNVWIPPGQTKEQAYRAAYAAESAALAATGRRIIFSESAPAYFYGTPDWLSALGWAGQYGQLWRLGYDIQIYSASYPDTERWPSVMTNYGYTRDVGRFTRPGNWNDPDFIIGGDPGLTPDEARSQLTLWSMMSAPLILSSDLTRVTQSPASVAILGNADVIRVDQDPLGEPAAVVAADGTLDVLVKRLANGDRAIAILNRGSVAASYSTSFDTLGFDSCAACSYAVRELWDGGAPAQIAATIPSHATAIFRVTQIH